MCSIAGARFETEDNAQLVVGMMETTAHRGPDQAGIADLHDRCHSDHAQDLPTDGLDGEAVLGHLRLAITGQEGFQPLHDCTQGFVTAFNGEIWNHKELRDELEDEHELAHDSDASVVPHVIERYAARGASLPDAVESALGDIDGEYAIAVMDQDTAVLARDPLGVKPLYYGHGDDGFAFASEQKALWSAGLTAERVPPNSLVVLSPQGVDTRQGLHRVDPRDGTIDSFQNAYRTYADAVEAAIAKRVRNVEDVVVVLSGGVDSALVAAGAERLGEDATCWVAGAPGTPDVEAAKQTADAMGLDLRVAPLEPREVATWLPELLRATEARNQLHIETALPLFAVCQAAREEGYRVLLTGQGADELTSGYPWYPKVLEADGPQELRSRMREDRDLLFKETLEREDRISMSQSLELRVPFLDPEVVQAAERIPLEFYLNGTDDAMGKRLHRELAEAWGVPASTAWRPKEAAQHGSGSREILKEAARLVEDSQPPDAYDPQLGVVGSSQRYGHKYTDEDAKWTLDIPLQWRLDHIAAQAGAIPPWEEATVKRSIGVAPEEPTRRG